MCSRSPMVFWPVWFPSLWLSLCLVGAATATATRSAGPMKSAPAPKWRTPLLSLHIGTLKPTRRPQTLAPRRERWLTSV